MIYNQGMKNIAKALAMGMTVVGTFVIAILVGYYTDHMVIGILVGAVMAITDILTMALRK